MRPTLSLNEFGALQGAPRSGTGAIVMQKLQGRRSLGAPPGLRGRGLGLFTPEERAAFQDEMTQMYDASPGVFWGGGVQALGAGAFWGGLTGLVASSSWKGGGQGALFLGGLAGVLVGGTYVAGRATLPGLVFMGAGAAGLALSVSRAMKGRKKRR